MEAVLVDSGVWLALSDTRDSRYTEGQEKVALFEVLRVVVPWPTMYETLRTRFVRNAAAARQLERYLATLPIIYLDDGPYRDAAFTLAIRSSRTGKRPLSMVDCLLRLLIDDVNVNVQYFATFNRRDFFDVCDMRGVEMI